MWRRREGEDKGSGVGGQESEVRRVGSQQSAGSKRIEMAFWPIGAPRGREAASAQVMEAIRLGSCRCGLLAMRGGRGGTGRKSVGPWPLATSRWPLGAVSGLLCQRDDHWQRNRPS
jgi:hypothetical protein